MRLYARMVMWILFTWNNQALLISDMGSGASPITPSPHVTSDSPLATAFNPFLKGPQIRKQGITTSLSELKYSGEPVLFEPLPTIELSRSSFTVTSFVSLKPYLQQFRNFGNYLTDFYYDVINPRRLTLLRISAPLPEYITKLATIRNSRNELGELENHSDNPWCEDTFKVLEDRNQPQAKHISDADTDRGCRMVCLSEPACQYYVFQSNANRCYAGYRGDDSEVKLDEGVAVERSATMTLYMRVHCEEEHFGTLTLDEMASMGHVKCRTFQCEAMRQHLDLINELRYVRDVFNNVFLRFLGGLDLPHMIEKITGIVYLPEDQGEPAQDNRASDAQANLTPAERNALLRLHDATQQLMKKYSNHTREERFAIMDLIFGWGMITNTMAIDALTDNVGILQDQNLLQDKQIKELGVYENYGLSDLGKLP